MNDNMCVQYQVFHSNNNFIGKAMKKLQKSKRKISIGPSGCKQYNILVWVLGLYGKYKTSNPYYIYYIQYSCIIRYRCTIQYSCIIRYRCTIQYSCIIRYRCTIQYSCIIRYRCTIQYSCIIRYRCTIQYSCIMR